jgi:hypothetical protein
MVDAARRQSNTKTMAARKRGNLEAVTPEQAHVERLRSMVEEAGESNAARAVGISRPCVARVLAKLPIRKVTNAALTRALGGGASAA